MSGGLIRDDTGRLFSPNFQECSKVIDLKFDKIEIGTDGEHYRMQLAHEVAHILHYLYITKPRPIMPEKRTNIQTFRQEVVAWRIAKSIIKPEHWYQPEAISCLKTYAFDKLEIKWNRLKIIAWRSK